MLGKQKSGLLTNCLHSITQEDNSHDPASLIKRLVHETRSACSLLGLSVPNWSSAVQSLKPSTPRGGHSSMHHSHSCDQASWHCILRKGWSYFTFFLGQAKNCARACSKWSLADYQYGRTMRNITAVQSSGQAAKLMV